jgi:hypothetical protein
MNSLNASNAPTADDKKGGFHEESVKWGTDASGNVVVSPSVPGAYAPPGTNPNTNFTPGGWRTLHAPPSRGLRFYGCRILCFLKGADFDVTLSIFRFGKLACTVTVTNAVW